LNTVYVVYQWLFTKAIEKGFFSIDSYSLLDSPNTPLMILLAGFPIEIKNVSLFGDKAKEI
jgi:hypothetical protein